MRDEPNGPDPVFDKDHRIPTARKPGWRALLAGGLLPVVLFTLVEEMYGTAWGVVAGMAFGLGEIAWERWRDGRVRGLTWGVNAMILVLGGVSLVADDGIWFKMQPALLEGAFAAVLWGSLWLRRPVLAAMAERQVPGLPAAAHQALRGLTARLGFFFALHSALATWAALAWSTRAWALLKGVGFTASLFAYFGFEFWLLKARPRKAPPGASASSAVAAKPPASPVTDPDRDRDQETR